jgi:hypothetical protein
MAQQGNSNNDDSDYEGLPELIPITPIGHTHAEIDAAFTAAFTMFMNNAEQIRIPCCYVASDNCEAHYTQRQKMPYPYKEGKEREEEGNYSLHSYFSLP